MRAPCAYFEVDYSALKLLFDRAAEVIDDTNQAEEQRWFRMGRLQRWWWGPKPERRGLWLQREMDTIMLARPYAGDPRILTSSDFLRTIIDIIESRVVPL